MILDLIVNKKKEEVARDKLEISRAQLEKGCLGLAPTRGLYEALKKPETISLIAEVKKASPSKGIIREDFDPLKIARIYTQNGAAAISVLTDESFFQGHPSYLAKIKEVTSLPLLRKEFIIDPYQIYQSRVLGADAILLIAAILDKKQLTSFQATAASLGMASLIEVHTEAELNLVMEIGAKIIGINNRNLNNFNTDLNTTYVLQAKVPAGTVLVSESGINTRQEVLNLQEAGLDAILVGEALMSSPDIGLKVRNLLGHD